MNWKVSGQNTPAYFFGVTDEFGGMRIFKTHQLIIVNSDIDQLEVTASQLGLAVDYDRSCEERGGQQVSDEEKIEILEAIHAAAEDYLAAICDPRFAIWCGQNIDALKLNLGTLVGKYNELKEAEESSK